MFKQIATDQSAIRRLKIFAPTIRYWMETEVHVYAFSIAANVLLSFFPFLIVMVSLCRYVLHWDAAEAAIYLMLSDFFPDAIGDFIRRNLQATVASRGPFQIVSLLLLVFAANGIFEPLEVALNKAWGGLPNRSYLKNQIISFGLLFACGGLALISTFLTALNREFFSASKSFLPQLNAFMSLVMFKMAAVPISILMLFLVYWLLPNRKIKPSQAAPPAIIVGLLLELLKYVNLLFWPWMSAKLQNEYGPFKYSVSIILGAALASMLVLAGAEWSARSARQQEENAVLPVPDRIDAV